ncbi:MAG: hypothetical protein H0U85_00955 [Gemmatimonadales bacterium]|nr:hypothetical protein [Gemmatimonadales bacterium]
MTGSHALIRLPAGSPDTVFLSEDRVIGGSVTARYWPRSAGWARIGADVDALGFDVRSSEEWTSWRAARRMLATRSRVADRSPRATQPDLTRTQRFAVPDSLLFLIFVATASFLWAGARRRAT